MATELNQRPVAGERDALLAPDSNQRWPWSVAATTTLAIVVITIIAVVSVGWSYRHFEQRLASQTQTALAANDISASNLIFEWSYRDLSVSGELPQGVSVSRLTELLRAVDRGGIRNLTITATESKAATSNSRETGTVDVSVKLQEGVLYLSGTVLSKEQRNRLQQAAKQAVGNKVVSRLQVSGLSESIPGADQRVESLANSIAGLDHAVDADAVLSSTDFRFSATVSDESDVDDLLRRRGVAGDLGLVISGDIIARKSSPDGVIEIDALYDSGRINLDGVVVSELHKQQLLASASAVVGAENVVDDLIVTNSADESTVADARVQLIVAAISTFPEALEAALRLGTSNLSVNALFEYEEDSSQLLGVRQQALDLGLNVEGEIQSNRISLEREVTQLQLEIDELVAEIRENVVFESAEAELDFGAKQTLDKIVDAMNRHQRPVVEITGHTDDTGSDDENRDLSLRRATSVSEYLRFSGIDDFRLKPLGLGESSHIANNQTEFGKKQNRRVEFRVRAGVRSKP